MAGVLYLFNYDDLAGVDLGLQPRVEFDLHGGLTDLDVLDKVDERGIDSNDLDGLGFGFLVGHCVLPFLEKRQGEYRRCFLFCKCFTC